MNYLRHSGRCKKLLHMRDTTTGDYVFSNSEFATFKDCRRKWWLAYHRGLEPRRIKAHTARDTGTLVHEALRRYYRNNEDASGAMEYLASQRAVDLAYATPHDLAKIHASHDLAHLIVEGYFEWLAATGADAYLVVKAVETAINIPGDIAGTTLTGKIDLQVHDNRNGHLYVLDHKTVGSFHDVEAILHLNEQGPLYVTLQRRGLPDAPALTGAVWNMLRKVKRGPKARPPFYARKELVITDAEIDRFWQQIHGQMQDILRVEDALRNGADHNTVAYPSPGPDCQWKCPFFAVCGLFNDPTLHVEDVIDANYTVGNPMARYDDSNVEGTVTSE